MALRLIPHIHRATHRIALHVQDAGLPAVSQAEAHVLVYLASAERPTIGDLHRAFGHKRSTLTSLLNRLERRGFATRSRDPRDQRAFVVRLTPRGRSAARRVGRHLQRFEAERLRQVRERDIRAFLRVLRRFEE